MAIRRLNLMRNMSRWLLTALTIALLLCRALARIGQEADYRYPFLRIIVFALINALLGVCIGLLVKANRKYANKYIVLTVSFLLVIAIPYLYYMVSWIPLPGALAYLFKVWETALLLAGTFTTLAIKVRIPVRELDQDIPEDVL